jgi:hypothetical protein
VLSQLVGECLCVRDNLVGILVERRLECLAEANCLAGDVVHQRATLGAREHGRVNRVCVLVVGHDDPASAGPDCLVCAAGDEIGDPNRGGVDTGGDQAGDVCDIGEVIRVDRIGDPLDLGELNVSRVRGIARNNHVRVERLCGRPEPLVIDVAGFGVDLVLLNLVGLSGEVCRMPVREVSAVVQRHREDPVAGVEDREIHRHVGLGAGVGLDVDVVGAPQLLGAVDGELLDPVGVLTAGVVALARIALGVFVGELRPLCFEHCLAGVVLAGNQGQRLVLSAPLCRQRVRGRRVCFSHLLVHTPLLDCGGNNLPVTEWRQQRPGERVTTETDTQTLFP